MYVYRSKCIEYRDTYNYSLLLLARGKIVLENIYKGSTDCREEEPANRTETCTGTEEFLFTRERARKFP